MTTYPYMLALDIPRSPLLSDEFSKDLLLKMEAAGISKPLATLSFATSKPKPPLAPSHVPAAGSSTFSTFAKNLALNHDKTLPPIPPKAIISLLELLERMDDDVAKEVQRVREGIKETYEMIDEYVQSRDTRMTRLEARKDRQKRETKGVGDDFWLNV